MVRLVTTPGSQSPSDETAPSLGAGELLRPSGATTAGPAETLQTGLRAARAAIPFGFLYDEVGSRLFTAITALDEYYLTRTEAAIMAANLPAMLAARPVEGCTMIDLGAGNCAKAAALFGAVRPANYVAVDVSVDFLAGALAALRKRHKSIAITGVGVDFSERLELPDSVPDHRRLFFYPGSSIGNFAPRQAERFLTQVRGLMDAAGTLWISVDLHKDKAVLERAYDDDLGVTAAFCRNVLRNTNRIAATDFDLTDWRYQATYDELAYCVTMNLVAVRDTTVRWPGGERRFAAGECIHIEDSYKYTTEGFTELLERAGLRRIGCWTDDRGWFGVFAAAPA